jgi:hypothetical protein
MSFMLLGILNSQAAAGGGGAAFDLLETTTLTTSASSVTFSGLDAYSDYKHLQIRYEAAATTSNGSRNLRIQYNGDTNTANYYSHYLHNSGSLVANAATSGSAVVGWQIWPSAGIGAGIVDILDFGSAKNTTHKYTFGVHGNITRIEFGSGLWSNTAPVTSLKIEQWLGYSMGDGSRFSLYGIKG